MEIATIKIARYRSADGQPTCCLDHPAGKVCKFLGTRKFGSIDVCMLGQERELGERGIGYTRPDTACEVWAQNETCADMLNLSRDQAQLMAGEMTAQEWRTGSAILRGVQSKMREAG